MSRHDLWVRLLWAVAGLKLVTALFGIFWGAQAEAAQAGGATILPRLMLLVPFFAFTLGGLLFLVGGRGDVRAVHLGTAFLLLATAFSNRPLLRLIESDWQEMGLPALWLSSLQVDAFLPYFLWKFTAEFPGAPLSFKTKRWLTWGARVSLATGVVLSAWWLGLLIHNLVQAPSAAPLIDSAPDKPSYGYYRIVLSLTTAALVFLLVRARTANGEEQRRARVFVLGLAGLVPFFTLMLVSFLIPPFEAFLQRREALPFYAIPFFCFSSVPFTTSYAVLIHHVLNVKLIARKALQYALARYTALSLATVPLVAIAVYLYNHKEQPLSEIFSGNKMLLLLSAALVGGAALRYRATLLDSIDRRFFREQYDARQILTLLVERIRAINDVAHLASLLSREIDLALHLEGVALLALDQRSGMMIDPRTRSRRLDASSELAQMISNASDPLAVDLDNPHSPLLKLPEAEQHWLVDNGFKLLVPILARDGSLIGLIGLGEKKSGLPFLKEDRQLLHAIASSSAWVLELEHSRSYPPRRSWRDPSSSSSSTGSKSDDPIPLPEEPLPAAEIAKECPVCGNLYPSYTVLCSSDSHRLEPAHVPYVLPGKFRFERRIGAGGMGVVYRGFDLALGRSVAVKTLRRVSPEDAMRLRREARTAAAVAHLHLAAVYGMETWQGTPMLVLELLEGGTLGQRVEARGKLSPREMVDLGIDMAEALAKLHAFDILHRDLKPSNIGFTKDGIPKLMDFGIARVMFDLRRDADSTGFDELDESGSILPPTSIWNQTPTSISVSRQLVGTLSYLSPEALNGEPADVSFDLWGLAIVLYETLIGRKVFTGGDVRQLMNRIKSGRVPDFSQVCPEHDEALGDFFRSALHRNVTRRPATAKEFKRQLEVVRERLVTA